MSRGERSPRIVPGSVDAHFHTLVMEEKGLPATGILRECFEAGMAYGLDIAVSLEDFEQRLTRLESLDRVYLTAGLHPSNAGGVSFETCEATLRASLSSPRVVALGEIGLDWFRDHGTRQEQRDLFASQIELANELRLPIIVHNRDATAAILDVFAAHPPTAESVMHCFSADAEAAGRFLDLGFSLSFGGNVTYRQSEDIRRAAARTPDDRILLETDAPFLAPQKVRGTPNHPGFVGYTYEFLADVRGQRVEELAAAARANFERIFLGR
ncbi:MAG: TatD family hydrolase [Spirochaetaceae bacterium]